MELKFASKPKNVHPLGASPAQVELGQEAYRLILQQIEHENGLMGARLQAGLTINGALIALTGAGLGFGRDLLRQLSLAGLVGMMAVLTAIAGLALVTSLSTRSAVRDARLQVLVITVNYSRNWRVLVEDICGLPRPFGGKLPAPDTDVENHRLSSWWADGLMTWAIVLWGTLWVAAL